MATLKKTNEQPTKSTDDQGREILVYPSGAVKLASNGQWLSGPTTAEHNPIIADPKAMQRRGVELGRERTRQAIQDEIGDSLKLDLSKMAPDDGWYYLVRHTVSVYLQSNNIRGMAETFTKLGQAAGYIGREGETVKQPGITASAEELAELLRLLEAETRARVDRALAVEAE